MRTRGVLTIASCISLALFLLLCATFPIKCHLNADAPAGWKLWGDTRIGAFKMGTISIYNGGFPYQGSILAVTSGPHVDPEWPHVTGFDGPGLYYRQIEFRDGVIWSTFTFSRVYPMILTAILPLVWIWRRRRATKRST